MFDTGVAIIELLTPKDGYIPMQGSNVSLQIAHVWALWEKLKNHPNIVKPLSLASWGDMGFRIVDPEGFQITFFTPEKLKNKFCILGLLAMLFCGAKIRVRKTLTTRQLILKQKNLSISSLVKLINWIVPTV